MSSCVLKVFHGEDVRRIRVDMPADDSECFEVVQAAVVKAFDMQKAEGAPVSVSLMCKDEDVLCELTPSTLCKLIKDAPNGCLRLYTCELECTNSPPDAEARTSVGECSPDAESQLGTAEFQDCAEDLENEEDVSWQSNASDEVHQEASPTSARPSSSKFASRMSDQTLSSLFKTDMEKKPDHVGEGFLQGLHHLGNHVCRGIDTLHEKNRATRQKDAMSKMKSTGEGLLNVGLGVWKGVFALRASTYEGLRHTPDSIADQVIKERLHNKHGVQGAGRGDLLESNLENEEEPKHVLHGFVRGGTGLVRGVKGGFRTLVDKPREAYIEKGAEGLAKGLGQGVLGLGTHVAAGALDYAVNMNLGWKNTPEAIARAINEHDSTVRDMPTNAPNAAYELAESQSHM